MPNSNEDSVMARCRRLTGIAVERRVALLTPGPLDFSTEDRRILSSCGIVTASLMASSGHGHLSVDWDKGFVSAATPVELPVSGGAAAPNLERLIQGNNQVDVATAARYLKLTVDHVRRLARTGKLTRVGERRPIQVLTASLRKYKGA
jgi:hypothetical protein